MKRFLLSTLVLICAICNIEAQYFLEYNEPEYLRIPDPPYNGVVTWATWSANNPNLTFHESGAYGAIIYPNHYFEGTAYVMCEYHYQYLFNGSYHFGADSVSYAITFNSNNATLNKSSITLNVGQTFLLSYTLQGSIDTSGYGGSPKMAWESSRESVATVDNNGRVTAIGLVAVS